MDFEGAERDLVDDLDLFYPLERYIPSLASSSEENKEADLNIPYVDHAESQNQARQAALSAFEQKFGKFSDVMVARYQKKSR